VILRLPPPSLVDKRVWKSTNVCRAFCNLILFNLPLENTTDSPNEIDSRCPLVCELCGTGHDGLVLQGKSADQPSSLIVDFACQGCGSDNEISSSLPLVCEICGTSHDGLERVHKIHLQPTATSRTVTKIPGKPRKALVVSPRTALYGSTHSRCWSGSTNYFTAKTTARTPLSRQRSIPNSLPLA